jgi:hypothetical protein
MLIVLFAVVNCRSTIQIVGVVTYLSKITSPL